MDRSGHQAVGKSVKSTVPAAKHDLAHRVVVGQHADDELAVEQVTHICRSPDTERLEFGDLIFATDIGDHRPPGCRAVCGHRSVHAAKPNETYFAHDRWGE